MWNAWRLHTLAQRLRREAFVHRLLLFRRRQLGYHIAWCPWRHVVQTNQLGRALVQHRHRQLVAQCWSRWSQHQAQRTIIRAKWARIPELFTQRVVYRWAWKHWYIATHQRVAVARPWVLRYVWQAKWRALMQAKRFARYVQLVKTWRAWGHFVRERQQRQATFQRRYVLLHSIVRRQLWLKYQHSLRHAWMRWQQLRAATHRVHRTSRVSSQNWLQTLCLSQAGQVMLFHQVRPLTLHQLAALDSKDRRRIPRLEVLRAHLWQRQIAPLEVADSRQRREQARRLRIYQRILREQARRDRSGGDAAAGAEDATTAAATMTLGAQRSLRERMAAVLTPGTSLGRYRSELSRAKVMEEARALYAHTGTTATVSSMYTDDSLDEAALAEDDTAWYLYDADQQTNTHRGGRLRNATTRWLSGQYIGLRDDALAAAVNAADAVAVT